MPEAGKKTRKEGYAEQNIMDAEDLHRDRYIHNPDMDYYEMLSLDSSASIEDIKKAYSELSMSIYFCVYPNSADKLEDGPIIQSPMKGKRNGTERNRQLYKV